MRIDAHQHFWKYDPVRDAWITDEMAVIKRDFLPDDLTPELKQHNIDGCVSVQADQSEKETDFLLKLSEDHHCIKAVVGWLDLCNKNVRERLEYYTRFEKIKGFRHILQSESPDFMLQKSFINGIAALSGFGYSYDILVFPTHLKSVVKLVQQFPDQPFVIDHLAKPYIKDGLIDEWRNDIKTLSAFDNVFCKISGMITEAKPKKWKKEDFTPYFDSVVELFGIDRIMFGSDWPVCLLEADYRSCIGLVENYFSSFSDHEKDKVFGSNAAGFYKIVH